ITVRDTTAADRFYKEVLGMSEIWRGGMTSSKTDWINMRVPEGTDYLEYMLIDGTVNRRLLGVLHHLALQVPDIQSPWKISGSTPQAGLQSQLSPLRWAETTVGSLICMILMALAQS